MSVEFIPTGTILAVLTNQVVRTAQAAKDVLFEKESFKALSQHLFDIEPVLKQLQLQKLNDSKATRLALESLEADVKKANNLVDKYKNRSRFYLLVKCRHIVKEVEEVTRIIGRSLAALSIATTEVLSEISDQVTRLQNEMQRVEFEASHSQRQIVDKLREGLKEQKLDQGFANDMLEEIARAVGVPVEPSEISKELASFRKEKEEASNRKERAEVFFLEQVIQLLSRADAAKDYEEVKKQYFQRVHAIERYDQREHIPPLNSFICPISGQVMVDPVSLSTGTTYERAEIEAWFDHGERIDPATGDFLEDLSPRSNLPLRQSIEEWRELNYCLKIRSLETKLLSGEDLSVNEALEQMQDLIKENPINKDWISIGGLTDIITTALGSSDNKDVKRKILITLKTIVEGHVRNKDKVVEYQGLDRIIPCLGRDLSISRPAVELLYELLQDRSGINVPVAKKISQQHSTFLFLVVLRSGPDEESAEIAEDILMKLFDEDEENISHAARAGWYKPLVNHIIQGTESSRMAMARTLVSMELIDQSIKELGEEGIIPPLLAMASGNLESKNLSLSVLVKLSACKSNKEIIANAGGVPSILKLMFSAHAPVVISKCCKILDNLSSNGDGTRYFVNEDRNELELEPIVKNLLAFQQNQISSHIIRHPALHTVLKLCKHEPVLIKKAVLNANGVSLVLPLLDDSDLEIREIAINLLFLFSQHETQGLVEYFLMPRRLEVLVGFLENEHKVEIQIAAAGLLANLPKSELLLTLKLIELNGLDAIMNILRTGTMEAKENALSALFRFTVPASLESQRAVVAQGAYPLLVNFLKTGSVTAKARAAALIGSLSLSSFKLADVTRPRGCWSLKRGRIPFCAAHEGVCSIRDTFCLLKAEALPELVKLLHGQVHATAYEAIQALSTLVKEESPKRGANVLHGADAIAPILEVLNWGSESLKGEALGLMEKVFVQKEMVEMYGSTARLLLVGASGRIVQEDSHVGRKAARVLAYLERSSRSSISIAPGIG